MVIEKKDSMSGIEKKNSWKKWVKKDDDLIRNKYYSESIEWLSMKLKRSKNATKVRARLLGVSKPLKHKIRRNWSSIDDAYLIKNYATQTAREVAVALGFPLHSIYHRVIFLGLEKSKQINASNWPKYKDKYLINNYKNKSNEELADFLGLSIGSISRRARKLGLTKVNPSVWSLKTDNLLKKNIDTQTVKELSIILSTSELTVRQRVRKFKLNKPKDIQQNRVYYICPQCESILWGKPSFSIICNSCKVSFIERYSISAINKNKTNTKR